MNIITPRTPYGRTTSSGSTILIFAALLFCSCGNRFFRNAEARDDAKEMELALLSNERIINRVKADVETKAVHSININDDTADDPAIWYNEFDPAESIIFGSNKKYGIHSYDLDGEEVQFVSCGTVNNIDIRKDVIFSIGTYDVLAGSHRSKNSIVIFLIKENGRINEKPDFEINLTSFDPYGFCLYKNRDNELFAFVNNKHGMIYQVSINVNLDNRIESKIINQFKLKTQVEGMVVDDVNHILYVGEEQTGIFSFDLKSPERSGKLLKGSTNANEFIRYDIEGLALIDTKFLVASSQGNFSYAIYDLNQKDYLTSFKIGDGQFDAVEETDGLDISTLAFGDKFPDGIIVVQDGFNYNNGVKESQNFKVIDLKNVLSIIE